MDDLHELEQRVLRVAGEMLDEKKYVTAVDLLVGLGWLPQATVDAWRQGRIEYLEEAMQVNPRKLSRATADFSRWAEREGLKASEAAYVSRTRDRRPLRFTESGEPSAERAYRTLWVSPDLSDAQRRRLAERLSRPPDLVVISAHKEWACASCGGTGTFLSMEAPGPVCMRCAGLDQLVFLPSGNAALTRRAKAASRQSAVVVRFSRSRGRYERQGILVEEAALASAEAERLTDDEARARRRLREDASGQRGSVPS